MTDQNINTFLNLISVSIFKTKLINNNSKLRDYILTKTKYKKYLKYFDFIIFSCQNSRINKNWWRNF